jgi:hypothetical protein
MSTGLGIEKHDGRCGAAIDARSWRFGRSGLFMVRVDGVVGGCGEQCGNCPSGGTGCWFASIAMSALVQRCCSAVMSRCSTSGAMSSILPGMRRPSRRAWATSGMQSAMGQGLWLWPKPWKVRPGRVGARGCGSVCGRGCRRRRGAWCGGRSWSRSSWCSAVTNKWLWVSRWARKLWSARFIYG